MCTHGTTMSRREILKGLAAGSVVVTAAGCTYNETLGRSQLLFVSEGQMAQLGAQAWSQQTRQQKVSRNSRYLNRFNPVVERVLRASGEPPQAWEYAVFEDKSANAFALPGNKIGMYTGMLDIMENDDQIAAVVGHEVGHVKARHGAERYSQSTLAQSGLTIAQVAVAASDLDQTTAQVAAVLGVSAVQFGVLLPFSRKHELEADKYGVRAMHRAGYDANQAVRLWQLMDAQNSGGRPPEFMSTHPSPDTRIAQLRREIALLPPRRV